jgi:hypothetical protein
MGSAWSRVVWLATAAPCAIMHVSKQMTVSPKDEIDVRDGPRHIDKYTALVSVYWVFTSEMQVTRI